MTPICPHCGYDLRADEMIELDGFHIDPRGTIAFAGRQLPLNLSSVVILATLAKAAPRMVRSSVLIDRIGGDGDDLRGTLYSQVRRLRRTLTAIGAPVPVASVRRSGGYRWEMPA